MPDQDVRKTQRFQGLRRWREGLRSRPGVNLVYRIGVGVVGTAVLVLGLLLVPYPGPGWLIVIGGLAILASEFESAQKVLRFVRHYYDAWSAWVKQQNRGVQLLLGLLTAAIVLLTLWLLGTLSLVGGWFGWDASWLRSPILG